MASSAGVPYTTNVARDGSLSAAAATLSALQIASHRPFNVMLAITAR